MISRSAGGIILSSTKFEPEGSFGKAAKDRPKSHAMKGRQGREGLAWPWSQSWIRSWLSQKAYIHYNSQQGSFCLDFKLRQVWKRRVGNKSEVVMLVYLVEYQINVTWQSHLFIFSFNNNIQAITTSFRQISKPRLAKVLKTSPKLRIVGKA